MRRTLVRWLSVSYSGLLVAPLLPFLLGDTLAALGGGVAAGAVVGALATSGRDVVDAVDARSRGVAGIVVPLAWAGPALFAESFVAAVLSPWAVGVAAAPVWVLVQALVTVIRNEERREGAETVLTFEARAPKRSRQLLLGFGVGSSVLAIAVVGATRILGTGGEATTSVLPAAMVPAILVSVLYEKRTVAVTDAGLVVDGALKGWDRFEGYELDDDALRLSAAGRFGDQEFDRADVEDPEAVADALERFVPRRGAR
jgi:hypothetical protein